MCSIFFWIFIESKYDDNNYIQNNKYEIFMQWKSFCNMLHASNKLQQTYHITIKSNQQKRVLSGKYDNNAGCTLQKWIFSKFDVVLVLLLTHFHNMCVRPNDCRKGIWNGTWL